MKELKVVYRVRNKKGRQFVPGVFINRRVAERYSSERWELVEYKLPTGCKAITIRFAVAFLAHPLP